MTDINENDQDEFGTEELDAETLAEIEALAAQASAEDQADDTAMNLADEESAAEVAADNTTTADAYADQTSATAAGTEADEVDPATAKKLATRGSRSMLSAQDIKDVLGDNADVIVSSVKGINAVKVRDKGANVLDYIRGAKSKMSNFTAIAVEALEGGELKSGDFVELFRQRGYSDGTARSQGQQMTTVLPALGISRVLKDGRHKLTKTAPVYQAIVQRREQIEAAASAAPPEAEAEAA